MTREYILKLVSALRVGQEIMIPTQEVADFFPTRYYRDAQFTPADNVLENVVGSAYGWSYRYDYMSRTVIFRRDKYDGEHRTYNSPDRR